MVVSLVAAAAADISKGEALTATESDSAGSSRVQPARLNTMCSARLQRLSGSLDRTEVFLFLKKKEGNYAHGVLKFAPQ